MAIKEENGPSAAGNFNTEASPETKKEAKKALDKLVSEYVNQSNVLSRVVRGDTRYQSAGPDKDMADKLNTHLESLGFQISIQTLVCARLDGVDVDGMITDIKQLIKEKAPNAPAPRGFF